MQIDHVTPQLRTTDLDATIRFYMEALGATLVFRYESFYAGIRLGAQLLHLKHVDAPDPSIDYVRDNGHLHLYINVPSVETVAESLRAKGVAIECDVHATDWGTRELIIADDQGHTLYFGQALEG